MTHTHLRQAHTRTIVTILCCLTLISCMGHDNTSNTSNGLNMSQSAAGTRHISDGAGNWTDTPDIVQVPLLDNANTGNDESICVMDGMTIIATQAGCSFSLEDFNNDDDFWLQCVMTDIDNQNTLENDNNKVMITTANSKPYSIQKINDVTFICEE